MICRWKPSAPPIASLISKGRWTLGMLCLALGVAGCVLPILPGLPFLVVSARLLGPHDPLLRRLLVAGQRAICRLRTAKQPFLRHVGRQLTPHCCRLARLLLG